MKKEIVACLLHANYKGSLDDWLKVWVDSSTHSYFYEKQYEKEEKGVEMKSIYLGKNNRYVVLENTIMQR